MGFNNEGVEAIVARLKKNKNVIIGGNIGKNKWTENDKAHEDYLYCFEHLAPYVDYFVVNVSSPNTPNLRSLQEKEPLQKLLTLLQEANGKLPKSKPILLKIAPDLTDEQLMDIIDIVEQTRIAGVIATNTTITREGLTSEKRWRQADSVEDPHPTLYRGHTFSGRKESAPLSYYWGRRDTHSRGCIGKTSCRSFFGADFLQVLSMKGLH